MKRTFVLFLLRMRRGRRGNCHFTDLRVTNMTQPLGVMAVEPSAAAATAMAQRCMAAMLMTAAGGGAS